MDYTENRKTKNSRQARAMAPVRATRNESQSVEGGCAAPARRRGRARAAPWQFHEGVLLMELSPPDGNAAPRLNDVELTPTALEFHTPDREVVRMLPPA